MHLRVWSNVCKKTRKLWSGGGEKEFGRLCQGYNVIKGKDVLGFIRMKYHHISLLYTQGSLRHTDQKRLIHTESESL